METKQDKKFSEKVIEKLHLTANEMEKFRLQATLGKYEARDMFETYKKKFRRILSDAKEKIGNTRDQAKDNTMKILNAIEMLRVQLSLGKAVTKEKFEEQRKKITSLLKELRNLLFRVEKVDTYFTFFLMELEKFMIKLEILKLKYQLNRFAAREEFENRKEAFAEKLDRIRARLGRNRTGKVTRIKEELGEAYYHLRKAFAG